MRGRTCPSCRSHCCCFKSVHVVVVLFYILLASLVCPASGALPDKFVALPPELGNRAPARLVFSAADLAQCWNDATARRCVLRAPVSVVEPTWRNLFASTGGVALQSLPLQPLTITSEPCSLRGGCLQGADPANSTERTLNSQQQMVDFNQLPGVIAVGSGAVLILINLRLNNVAYKSAYIASEQQPYKADGMGTGLWPSINFAPNASLVVVNSSVTYTNPSSTDTCADYVQRGLFNFQQVYGDQNITSVNATTTRVVGPVLITVVVRDGATSTPVGNSTSRYRNVTFTCMERPYSPTGLPPGALAAAIAVPAVVAALAWLLLLWWCRRRRTPAGLKQPHDTKHVTLVAKDVEAGDDPSVHHVISADAYKHPHPDSATQAMPVSQGVYPAGPMPYSFGGSSLLWSSPSNLTSTTSVDHEPLSNANSTAGLSAMQQRRMHPSAGTLPSQQPASSQGLQQPVNIAQGSGRAANAHSTELQLTSSSAALTEDKAQNQYNPRSSGGVILTQRTTGATQYSSSASGATTPKTSIEMQRLNITPGTDTPAGMTGGQASALGFLEERRSTLQAVLKARSNVAVLRELKIGPLLGRGSYGRVYRGRWKASLVAVKIIEHYGVDAQASSGSRRLSAGREMLFATSVSHPNLVTCFHHSTMTIAERSALARSWLADGRTTPEEGDEVGEDDDAPAADSTSTSSTTSGDDSPPDLLETWIIMEYCERGSLERAVKGGKFHRKMDGQPEMVGIFKVLLDTASGLDYLHSIGVVHGDLKTANVLLKDGARDPKGVTCKITDFGLSKVLDSQQQTHISTGTYGTIVYMPKELLLSGRMTQATDIYSFGLMMWELFTGQPVMEEGLSIGQMFYMIAYQDWKPDVPDNCPLGYADLMTACWHEVPEQRPSSQQLLRRLQKLYLQAKQQELAVHSPRAGSSASGRAVGQRGSTNPRRPSLDETSTPSSKDVMISSPLRVSLDMEPGQAYVLGGHQHSQQHQRPGLPTQELLAQQQQQQQVSSGVSINSTPAASTTSNGRRSQDSGVVEQEGDQDYEPFVHAVLHRATSLAVPPRHSHSHSFTQQPQATAAAAAAAAAAFAAADGSQPISSGPMSPFQALQLAQQEQGWSQLPPLAGAASIDPAAQPIQPLTPAVLVTLPEVASSEGMPSGSVLQHLSASSDAEHDVAGDGFEDLQQVSSDSCRTPSDNQQYQAHAHIAQQQQQQQERTLQQQSVLQLPSSPQPQQQQHQIDTQRRRPAYWPSYLDALPPDAPDFSVTESFLQTLAWASRPEVAAAASASAARTLAAAHGQPGLHTYGFTGPATSYMGYHSYDTSQEFAGWLHEFPAPGDPADDDRIQAYLTALDMARTPSAVVAVTHAIIADAAAQECAAEQQADFTAGDNAAQHPDYEADAAVVVDSMRPYTHADGALVQPGCYEEGLYRYQAAAAAAAAASEAADGPVAPPEGQEGGSSSSVNLSVGAGYSSNSTAAHRSHGSSSGVGRTYSSTFGSYSGAPWTHLAPDEIQGLQRQQQDERDNGPQSLVPHSRIRPASLAGPPRGPPRVGPANSEARWGFVPEAGTRIPAELLRGSAPPPQPPQPPDLEARWGFVPEVGEMAPGSTSPGNEGFSSGSFAVWAAAGPSNSGAGLGQVREYEGATGGEDLKDVANQVRL